MKEMNEEKITKDNEFSQLKNLLKELPKVDTPDNFEFNLMTKIQNKNFEVKPEKKKSWLSWALTPAIAFSATVFVLVLFVFSGEESINNPWETPPKLMEQNIADVGTNINVVKKSREIAKSKMENKATSKKLVAKTNNTKAYPFDKNSSINFDEYLQTEDTKSANSGAQLAGSQSMSASPFDGFFLRQREIAKKKDSVRKAQDSLQQTNKAFK
jgi:cytoskeletal protein RodZ